MIQRFIHSLKETLAAMPAPVVTTPEPRSIVRLAAVAVLAAAALYGATFIHPEPVAKTGAISITHPWAKGGARQGQQLPIYATFENAGPTEDRLISATSPLAERTIIKELDRQGGLIAVRELATLTLPAQSRQTLRPGQSQITLAGLKTSVAPGDSVPLTLQFERAGTVELKVIIENLGEPDHPEHFPATDKIDERGVQRR